MAFADRTFWVYPWDIADGSVGERLEEIRNLGANAISIPFSYHSLRALAPHCSGHKVINATAAIYFRPRPEEFPPAGIQPWRSEWASDEGPIPDLFSQAESFALRVRAWTVVFHNTPLASAHPDAAIRNCFGEVFAHALCPSAPKSRDYAVRLVRAVSARPIHAIELEAAGFYGYQHSSHHDKCGVTFDLFHHFLFSCCFCPYCQNAFRLAGLDPEFISERFQVRLLQFLEGEALATSNNNAGEAFIQLCELLGEDVASSLVWVRNQCVLGLLHELRKTVPAGVELTVSTGLSPFECSALFGAYPKETLEIVDRLLLVVFEPTFVAFKRRFDDALKSSSDRSRWIAGIQIFPLEADSERAIEAKLDYLRQQGFGAIHLYHYGLAPQHLLVAAGRAWKMKREGTID